MRRCDWRVIVHEIRGSDYYEIRKAHPEHSCLIKTRIGYKNRTASRVIDFV